MRDLPQVIDAMLAVIPAGEHRLHMMLGRVKQNCEFTAPEIMADRWRHCYQALVDVLVSDPSAWTDWQRAVVAIFKGDADA